MLLVKNARLVEKEKLVDIWIKDGLYKKIENNIKFKD